MIPFLVAFTAPEVQDLAMTNNFYLGKSFVCHCLKPKSSNRHRENLLGLGIKTNTQRPKLKKQEQEPKKPKLQDTRY